MILSIIGMSGTGKSYWSKRLEQELQFQRIGLDDLIEAELTTELQGHGIQSVARWMGFPYENRYSDNESRYLQLEELVLSGVLDALSESEEADVVIDTTGSVVYLPDALLKTLKANTTIVHLDITRDTEKLLFDEYLRNPKPIVWGDSFTQREGESDKDALARSYRDLIDYRLGRYRALADISIEPAIHRRSDLSVKEFIGAVQERASSAQ